jgi:excisionase family DNA binding protein
VPLDNKNGSELPKYLTPKQTQELLQISRATFFRMVSEDRLPGAFKLGDSWRVDSEKLIRWIDEKTEDRQQRS